MPAYTAADFLRMSWRNIDAAIACLAKGEVDNAAAERLNDRLYRCQDVVAAVIDRIHAAQEQPDDEL